MRNQSTSLKSLFFIGALFAAGCGSSGSSTTTHSQAVSPGTSTPPAAYEALELRTITRGQSSDIVTRSPQLQLLSNTLDWLTLWQSHQASMAPNVDFGRDVVVARIREQMPSGGYSTEVVQVTQDLNSGQLIATVRDASPAPGAPVTSNMTQPHHMVAATFKTPATTLQIKQQRLLGFTQLDSGARSNIGFNDPSAGRSLHVARDQAELDAFWQQHAPGAQPPVVDFSSSMVVAVLGGYNPNFGNTVNTKRMVYDAASDTIRVQFEVEPYRGGAAPPVIFTAETPFQILQVARSAGQLRFETLTRVSHSALSSGPNALYQGSRELLIIRDAATFSNVWQQRVGGAQPNIDFSTQQVVAYFHGRGTSNVSANIASLELSEDGELMTRVHTQLLGGGTSPYSLVVTTKTSGLPKWEIVDVTPRP